MNEGRNEIVNETRNGMKNQSMIETKIWEEQVVIPTYEVGEPDKNPMFLEKRVYQGSSGKVYPYSTTEKISQVKTDKTYKAVYLENAYIKIMILPELGGRIQRAYDKTNDYDFVYYNHVIKPALVGLAGPWISGGIEFNWPQHHRPTTYMPVDYLLQENADGSKTLLVNDVDQMYGTKGIAAFTLYPDKAYIEIKGQLYNRTSMAQTFLWWANPAVAVNENTQSIFPPDVHSVMDHGKRDVSRFPIAKGVYYKHDYSEGVDISRYRNIPVPTSYMAEKSEYDFVGGYDYGKEAGLLHVADHHVSPGKKQWTWGCGEFGRAWDRNLTDEDGPYIELMTGVYTENQPDFTWLKPFEEKTFKQYFMPYKKVGAVKNATIHAALNVEFNKEGIVIVVYGTGLYEQAVVVVTNKEQEILRDTTKLSPIDIYETICKAEVEKPQDILVQVWSDGKLLVEYQPKEDQIPELAKPAEAAKEPEEIRTNEELLLTGQHIEQHRHATYLPDPYYLEGLKRDKGDSRINNAYGMLLLRRGYFHKAESYFQTAVKRLTYRSPNPYNSESYYNLGLSLLYQERLDEAFDAFYKATWSSEQQEMSFYYLAVIAARRGHNEEALEFIEKALVKNRHHIKARGIKAVILRKLGRMEEARQWIRENLNVDAFDYLSRFEWEFLNGMQTEQSSAEERKRKGLGTEDSQAGISGDLHEMMRNFHENYLQTARDYAEAGCYEEAIAVLSQCTANQPMLAYYRGYYAHKAGQMEVSAKEYQEADQCSPDYCFPNKLEDIAVLTDAIAQHPAGAKAYYYLGNLYYDKLQFDKAVELWEQAEALDGAYPTVHRNLALAYYNKQNNPQKAKTELELAFALDETDTRVFLELDQLYKKLGMPAADRLRQYEAHRAILTERDDVMLEFVTLYNLAGMHEQAYETIMSHNFRPWEGAEGRISGQYKIACLELAKGKIEQAEDRMELTKGLKSAESSEAVKLYKEAGELLTKALVYPKNLGEGRLEGTKDNQIHYYLGVVELALGRAEAAKDSWEKACMGENEPASAMYYYDQPADMILYQGLANHKLGNQKAAYTCYNKLMDYGERHLNDEVKQDYFAVSLPDFMIFEEDRDHMNKAHCHYLMGLAYLGFGSEEEAEAEFSQALQYDYNHQNCRIYLAEARKQHEKRTRGCDDQNEKTVIFM